jgi:hypothetical protein
MGTRGYYVYKYKGKYYVFYNHYDSYDLHDWILNDLKKCTKEDFIKMRLLLDILPERTTFNDSSSYKNIMYALESQCEYFISDTIPRTDIFIEYVCIIDLDNNCVFSKCRHTEAEFCEKCDYKW